MTYQLFHLPKAALSTGATLKASWKLYLYVTTTTTQAIAYTTSALDPGSVFTQPIQADSGGTLPAIYLDPSVVYKASVYDQNDVFQYTVDPVNDLLLSQSVIGALLYPRTAAENLASVTPTYTTIPSSDVLGYVDPRRYGTNTTPGTTDMTTTLQTAVLVASKAGFLPVQLQPETYKITSTLYGNGSNAAVANGVPIYGVPGVAASSKTKILCTGLGAVAALKYRGIGAICGAQVRDIFFEGDSNTICVEFSGMVNMRAVRCTFGTSAEGIRFHNEDTGQFTEYCIAEACDFQNVCTQPIRYKVTSGNNSFHGSGMVGRCTVNLKSACKVVQVDSGAFVYNAPLDFQIWNWGTATIINSDAVTPQASFFGTITYEVYTANTITLGTGQPIAFAGTVAGIGNTTSTGANVLGGTLVRCEAVTINGDSSASLIGAKRSYRTQMAVGANTLTSVLPGNNRLLRLRLTATSYEYQYLVAVVQSATGGTTTAAVVATLEAFNVAGYGAPTFSTAVAGHLIVTNANAGFVNVVAIWSELAIDAGPVNATTVQI